jgi:CubicO group peptidase (beta-lactamase class C family)
MSIWNADLQRLMVDAAVPGAASAVIRDSQATDLECYGVRDVRGPALVDEATIFDAASLSKPVFAYIVLQLVEEGRFNLNIPISQLLPKYFATDQRTQSIAPIHVLSHRTGLPNWRNIDLPLRTYFAPGDRFSYSGEGYLYLQRAVECATGETVEAIARRLVFEPLGMDRTSFVWQDRFDSNRAVGHDAFGMPALSHKPGEANAAWTLQTCAADYARFLRAVVDGARLSAASARLWMTPQVAINHRGSQWLEPINEEVVTGVSWGLGWGLEPAAGTFFHWGDNGPFTSFTLGSLRDRSAIVVFTNAASGHSVMPQIIERFMPGSRSSLNWLDYVRHDAPVRRLLSQALARGAEAAWPEIEEAGLDRDKIIWIAQGLNARGQEEDALWLRTRVDVKQGVKQG